MAIHFVFFQFGFNTNTLLIGWNFGKKVFSLPFLSFYIFYHPFLFTDTKMCTPFYLPLSFSWRATQGHKQKTLAATHVLNYGLVVSVEFICDHRATTLHEKFLEAFVKKAKVHCSRIFVMANTCLIQAWPKSEGSESKWSDYWKENTEIGDNLASQLLQFGRNTRQTCRNLKTPIGLCFIKILLNLVFDRLHHLMSLLLIIFVENKCYWKLSIRTLYDNFK